MNVMEERKIIYTTLAVLLRSVCSQARGDEPGTFNNARHISCY